MRAEVRAEAEKLNKGALIAAVRQWETETLAMDEAQTQTNRMKLAGHVDLSRLSKKELVAYYVKLTTAE